MEDTDANDTTTSNSNNADADGNDSVGIDMQPTQQQAPEDISGENDENTPLLASKNNGSAAGTQRMRKRSVMGERRDSILGVEGITVPDHLRQSILGSFTQPTW